MSFYEIFEAGFKKIEADLAADKEWRLLELQERESLEKFYEVKEESFIELFEAGFKKIEADLEADKEWRLLALQEQESLEKFYAL